MMKVIKMNPLQWIIEYPQYTRPFVFEDEKVPEVLVSGHHENIRQWRRYQSLKITEERRPDLFKNYQLSKKKNVIQKYSGRQQKMTYYKNLLKPANTKIK